MNLIALIVDGLVQKLRDPRYYQIAVLGSLLTYGIAALDFSIAWENALGIVAAAQLTQYAAMRFTGASRFDPLSALTRRLHSTPFG